MAADTTLADEITEVAEGAEFLGATDIAESVGIYAETLTNAFEIAGRHWQVLDADWRETTAMMAAAKSPQDLVHAVSHYHRQRFDHGLQAVTEWMGFLAKEQVKLMQTHRDLLTVFTRTFVPPSPR